MTTTSDKLTALQNKLTTMGKPVADFVNGKPAMVARPKYGPDIFKLASAGRWAECAKFCRAAGINGLAEQIESALAV
jgi:hypothetical protein